MTGQIVKLMRDKMFGFIEGERDKKQYFFHASGLKNIKYDELTEGREVEFEEVDSPKGLRAEDIYV
jgi:cold shock CspA family protein